MDDMPKWVDWLPQIKRVKDQKTNYDNLVKVLNAVIEDCDVVRGRFNPPTLGTMTMVQNLRDALKTKDD